MAAAVRGAMRDVAAVVAILVVAAVSWPVLRAAPVVVRRMGTSGEAALSKVMGLLILCVGIQFLINGIGMVVRDLAR